MSLYLTPTRLRLMLHIQQGWVRREARQAWDADGEFKVTARVEELVDAGYAEMPEHPQRNKAGRSLYALTDVGLAEMTLRLGKGQS